MESVENNEVEKSVDSKFKQEIYSKVIRAGKRTYFFDVKCTRNNEYYLTITESKRRYSDNGNFQYEKHKIFLYKEDFEKFAESFQDVIGFITENQPEKQEISEEPEKKAEKEEEVTIEEESSKDYTNVDFDDI